MTEQWDKFLWAILAVVCGFVIKEFINYFFFERYRKWTELKGKITHALVFHASIFSNGPTAPIEYWDETTKELRGLAAGLCEFANIRHRMLFLTPKPESLFTASSNLIGLSKSSHEVSIQFVPGKVKSIRKELQITDIKSLNR